MIEASGPIAGVKDPQAATLARYGLELDGPGSWRALLRAQGGVCAVCGRVPSSGRMTTDHEHVKGWRHMPPEARRVFVRGILCFWCNRTHVARGMTIERAGRVAEYLRVYELRRDRALLDSACVAGTSRGRRTQRQAHAA